MSKQWDKIKNIPLTIWLVLVLLCLSLPTQEIYAHAGLIIFTDGTVIIKSKKGKVRKVKRGSKVRTGDIVMTKKNSRVQIRAGDGSFISLQPKSELLIAVHKHAGEIEKQKSVIELMKGGMRAVTGLIGKNKPENFRIKVRHSSIGIRGTEFIIQICDDDCRVKAKNSGKSVPDNGVYVGVISGAITVENNKKVVKLDAGLNVVLGKSMGVSKEKFQYVYIEEDNSAPEILTEAPKILIQAMAPPPPVPLSKRKARTLKPKRQRSLFEGTVPKHQRVPSKGITSKNQRAPFKNIYPEYQRAPFEGIDPEHLKLHLASTIPIDKTHSVFDEFEKHAYPAVPDVHSGLREIRPPYTGHNISDGLNYDLTSGRANFQ